MRRILAVVCGVLAAGLALACGSIANTTEATFTNTLTLPLPYSPVTLVVQHAGPGSYLLARFPRDHPMSSPDHCQVTVTAGRRKHVVTTRGLDEVVIDDAIYGRPVGTTGPWTVTIDLLGKVTTPPKLPPPAPAPAVPAAAGPG